MTAKREVFNLFREKMPAAIENINAMVALGIPKASIVAKMKEFTPLNVPPEVWMAIDWSIDCIIEDWNKSKSDSADMLICSTFSPESAILCPMKKRLMRARLLTFTGLTLLLSICAKRKNLRFLPNGGTKHSI